MLFRCKCGNCSVTSLQNISECYYCSELERCQDSIKSDLVLEDVGANITVKCVTERPGFEPFFIWTNWNTNCSTSVCTVLQKYGNFSKTFQSYSGGDQLNYWFIEKWILKTCTVENTRVRNYLSSGHLNHRQCKLTWIIYFFFLFCFPLMGSIFFLLLHLGDSLLLVGFLLAFPFVDVLPFWPRPFPLLVTLLCLLDSLLRLLVFSGTWDTDKNKKKVIYSVKHMYLCNDNILYDKCDLSRENVQQRFSVERLRPLATRWRRWWKHWRRWKSCWVFFFTRWRRWKKLLGNISQTVGNVAKSRWVLFPYPLKALRKAVGKIRPTRCYSAVNSLIYGSD